MTSENKFPSLDSMALFWPFSVYFIWLEKSDLIEKKVKISN